MKPPLNLHLLDIDTSDVSEFDRARYDLEVPVMCIQSKKDNRIIQLPRVSPRISSEMLSEWLKKIIKDLLGIDIKSY